MKQEKNSILETQEAVSYGREKENVSVSGKTGGNSK